VKRRNVKVRVVDSIREHATDTQWDGGTKSYYATWGIGKDSVTNLNPAENEVIEVTNGAVLVELCCFCGEWCDPVITVREADVLDFFGYAMHAVDGMPAGVNADMLEEKAEYAKPAVAKRMRDTAVIIRKALGLVAA
jgi:hypothetical protein